MTPARVSAMKSVPTSVWDIPRNDIEACLRFWASRRITGEEWRTMLQLQDDPAELIEAMRHATERVRKRADADWEEDLHPRAEDGKFSSGGDANSGPSAKKEPTAKSGGAVGRAREKSAKAPTKATKEPKAEPKPKAAPDVTEESKKAAERASKKAEGNASRVKKAEERDREKSAQEAKEKVQGLLETLGDLGDLASTAVSGEDIEGLKKAK